MRLIRVAMLIILTLLLVIIVVVFMRFNEKRIYEKRGHEVIKKVEEFKAEHGYFPKSIKDVEIEETMGEGPYYRLLDSALYMVYFNIGFDEALAYYSDSKRWVWGPNSVLPDKRPMNKE